MKYKTKWEYIAAMNKILTVFFTLIIAISLIHLPAKAENAIFGTFKRIILPRNITEESYQNNLIEIEKIKNANKKIALQDLEEQRKADRKAHVEKLLAGKPYKEISPEQVASVLLNSPDLWSDISANNEMPLEKFVEIFNGVPISGTAIIKEATYINSGMQIRIYSILNVQYGTETVVIEQQKIPSQLEMRKGYNEALNMFENRMMYKNITQP